MSSFDEIVILTGPQRVKVKRVVDRELVDVEQDQYGLIFIYDNLIPKKIGDTEHRLVPTPAHRRDPQTGEPDLSRPLIDPIARLSQVLPPALITKFNEGTAAFERVNHLVNPGSIANQARNIVDQYLINRELFQKDNVSDKFELSGTLVQVNVEDGTFDVISPHVG